MGPSGVPSAAEGSAEGSASPLESEGALTLAHLFRNITQSEATELLSSLLREDDARFAHLGQLLHDETACGEVLGALRALSSMPARPSAGDQQLRCPTPLPRSTSSTPRPPRRLTFAERRPWQVHRCSTPGGCLSALAEKRPELLDALRERLLKAVESAKSSKTRADLMPERRASKKLRLNSEVGKVSSSAAMDQALAAMATCRSDSAAPTPAAEATAAVLFMIKMNRV